MTIKKTVFTKNTSGKSNTKEYIILHHTATWYWSLKGVLNHFVNWSASCHYIVDTNWDIFKMNTDDDILRHAWLSSREDKNSMNNYSIWIEVIWPLPWFTDFQRKAVRLLILDLMSKYNIPYRNIIRHKDVSPKRKVDIYDEFWNTQYSSFKLYQNSFWDIKKIYWLYESLFQKEFSKNISNWENIIKNIDWTLSNFVNSNGNFDVRDFFYFVNIAIERLVLDTKKNKKLQEDKKDSSLYENIFQNEFQNTILKKDTLIKKIDISISDLIMSDGTLNLKDFLYFVMIWIERIRKKI